MKSITECKSCKDYFDLGTIPEDGKRYQCFKCYLWAALSKMKVPARYRTCTFQSYDSSFNHHKDIVNQVYGLAEAHRWIFLSGTVGIGKTHLAVSAMYSSCCKSVKSDESRYRYIPMRTWGSQLAMSGVKMNSMVQETTGGKRCILLDDLGREPTKAVDRICMILDDYYGHCKQVIATTNLSAAQLLDLYGDSIMDRIIESGSIIELTGKSYRLTGGK